MGNAEHTAHDHSHDHGHAHHHEESWVSKYIFSQDHKMISKQFLITAIVMGVIAVMLSLFFRLQLGWPGEKFQILNFFLGDAAGAIASFRTTLQSLQQVVSGKQRSIDADKASKQFIENMLRDYNSGGLPGMSTGIAELDEICGGMRPGEFWVIAGKPSRGKSVLMLQIASKFISDQRPVAIHSLEMMTHEVIGRLISTMTHTDYGSITQPRSAAKHELQKIQTGVAQISAAPLWIDSSSNQSIDSIAAEAERIRDLHGSLDLVVVDYLQLMQPGSSGRESNRVQEVSEISRGLKALARELGIPVLALSQLSRQIEMRGDSKEPRLSDLRESGAIEQDADVVIFLWRKADRIEETDAVGEAIDFSIAKHRNGPTGAGQLYFMKEQTRFVNLVRERNDGAQGGGDNEPVM